MAGEHRRSEFSKINVDSSPHPTCWLAVWSNFTSLFQSRCCVPTLVDHDFVLCESKAILIYLAEKCPRFSHSMYPKCTRTRAVIHERLFHDSSDLYVRVLDVANLAFSSIANPTITVHHRENLRKALRVLEVRPLRNPLKWHSRDLFTPFSPLELLRRSRIFCRQPSHNRWPFISGVDRNLDCKFSSSVTAILEFSLWTFLDSPFKRFGFKISSFKNVSNWYERMKEIQGFRECEQGAQEFADIVKGKITNSFQSL